MKFKDVIHHLLRAEGGYVNDPDDVGGETKYGITKRTYPRTDIKNLTKDAAMAIYKQDWWTKLNIELLPVHLRFTVFDFAVNAGASRAIKLLQKMCGVKEDGVIGKITAYHAKDVSMFDYNDRRREYYIYQSGRFKSQLKFRKGWLKRVDQLEQFCIKKFKLTV